MHRRILVTVAMAVAVAVAVVWQWGGRHGACGAGGEEKRVHAQYHRILTIRTADPPRARRCWGWYWGVGGRRLVGLLSTPGSIGLRLYLDVCERTLRRVFESEGLGRGGAAARRRGGAAWGSVAVAVVVSGPAVRRAASCGGGAPYGRGYLECQTNEPPPACPGGRFELLDRHFATTRRKRL